MFLTLSFDWYKNKHKVAGFVYLQIGNDENQVYCIHAACIIERA